MSRGDLTDAQWERLEPAMPPIPKMRRPPTDRRQVCDGTWWRARTFTPVAAMPVMWSTDERLDSNCRGRGVGCGHVRAHG
ncbi:transposase [Streptomyces sp. NPDC046925]|uniref:transposase n=1 Tax=Streptomyces sp. NPDC046925 TaxID=3155375 RepID=UPI0034060D0F